MIELTIEQHDLAAADPETPKRVLDPVSRQVFVLMPIETYDRDFGTKASNAIVDVGLLVDRAMAEYDEDDPLLESYQHMRGEE